MLQRAWVPLCALLLMLAVLAAPPAVPTAAAQGTDAREEGQPSPEAGDEADAPRWNERPDVPPPTGAQAEYWRELVAKAEAQRLWEDRFWHLLLHYIPAGLGGGVESEADGPGFFLAPDGKTNPRAELVATLGAFFSDKRIPPTDMTPQCTFPARFRWLDERLGLDPAQVPRQTCNRLERWLGRVNADSVSLIFSSYFFNNPGSMFGHTLLRFNRKGRTEDTALLDYALNYAALVNPEDSNFAYMIKGVFGGYVGHFSMLPYYLKVREYNAVENRDLWEYELELSPERVQYMVLHTWELGSTYFVYYFFGENCSYHLLSLIEIGDPSLHLREDYGLWVLPTDTVLQVAEQPGLVRKVIYRPSQSSQMAQKLAVMTDAEQDWTARLVDDPAAADTPEFAALPRDRAALTLDAAIDLYQYRLAGRPKGAQESRARLRALLLRRSRIPVSEAPPQEYPPRGLPPERGHASARTTLALGASRPAAPGADGEKRTEPFVELSVQASYHDLLSDDRAFAPNSNINLLHLQGRLERTEVPGQPPPAPGESAETVDHWRLERFSVVDLVSLFPLSQISSLPSWKLFLGWERNRDGACEGCVPFRLHPGGGYAVQTNLIGRELFYLMLDAVYENAERYAPNRHRAGFGLSAGMLLRPTEAWTISLSGTGVRYTSGARADVGEAALRMRFTLSRNLELGLDWRGVEDYREGKLELGYYF